MFERPSFFYCSFGVSLEEAAPDHVYVHYYDHNHLTIEQRRRAQEATREVVGKAALGEVQLVERVMSSRWIGCLLTDTVKVETEAEIDCADCGMDCAIGSRVEAAPKGGVGQPSARQVYHSIRVLADRVHVPARLHGLRKSQSSKYCAMRPNCSWCAAGKGRCRVVVGRQTRGRLMRRGL